MHEIVAASHRVRERLGEMAFQRVTADRP